MLTNLRQPWIAALRSGAYEQIKDSAYAGSNQHCATSVLVKVIADREGLSYDEVYMRLLPSNSFEALSPSLINTVIEMNDTGFSFNAIAKFLELEMPDDSDPSALTDRQLALIS